MPNILKLCTISSFTFCIQVLHILFMQLLTYFSSFFIPLYVYVKLFIFVNSILGIFLNLSHRNIYMYTTYKFHFSIYDFIYIRAYYYLKELFYICSLNGRIFGEIQLKENWEMLVLFIKNSGGNGKLFFMMIHNLKTHMCVRFNNRQLKTCTVILINQRNARRTSFLFIIPFLIKCITTSFMT